MKVSDLIDQLKSCDSNSNIRFVALITKHYCGSDQYCYCSSDDVYFDIGDISTETIYDKKTKTQKIVGFCLRGYEV